MTVTVIWTILLPVAAIKRGESYHVGFAPSTIGWIIAANVVLSFIVARAIRYRDTLPDQIRLNSPEDKADFRAVIQWSALIILLLIGLLELYTVGINLYLDHLVHNMMTRYAT